MADGVSDSRPASRVEWQYYRTVFGVKDLPQNTLDAWGWDKSEGWWAAEDREEAEALASIEGNGTFRSRIIHMTYDEWEEEQL